MATHIYAPVGRCIYCGSTTSDLGDEHIIPFALNGGMVLPKASCHTCERIIQRYEMSVARQIFGNFRIKYDVQTRNKNQRPSHLKIGTLRPDGTAGTAEVPAKDHATMTVVYKYSTPTFLLFYPPEVEKNTWIPYVLSSKEELEEFTKKYHWDKRMKFKSSPDAMARQLAKIAYCYVVAELGLDNFQPFQMALDTILCRTNNVCHMVGSKEELPEPDPKGMHLLGITCLAGEPYPNPLLIVGIRLFPAFHMPEYHVVVGYFDLTNERHAKTFAEKVSQESQVTPSWIPERNSQPD